MENNNNLKNTTVDTIDHDMVSFRYTGENGNPVSKNIDYDKISHCRIIIDTVYVHKSIIYVPLFQYSYKSVEKYINCLSEWFHIEQYNVEDFDIGNYIGDNIYMREVLDTLTKSIISYDLFELMIMTDNIKNYTSRILKSLTKYASDDHNLLALLYSTSLNKNKIIKSGNNDNDDDDDNDNDDHNIFDNLVNSLSSSDIITLLNKYSIWNHVVGTYVYIRLCKEGFKKCGNAMIEFMQYRDTEQIFCREILELYCDENVHVNIFLSQIFELKNNVIKSFKSKDIIKYRRTISMGYVGSNVNAVYSNIAIGRNSNIAIGGGNSNTAIGRSSNIVIGGNNSIPLRICNKCTNMGLYR
uniref:Uncharacterized protein n=1 Tax=Pithovirus LCPAC102 TaxID=2506587 RepID=A0A481Z6F4_9VIRU|nr:MAG: hypothetical protein LCPAC102_02240 [Pithovirus LCPAC102]